MTGVRRETLGTDTRENDVKTQGEDGHLQAKERGLGVFFSDGTQKKETLSIS